MANTRIQIKRAQSTAAPGAGSLYAGELAWSNASQLLYIGNYDVANTVTPIGSKLNFGTLTANAVMVTNSTSGIDKIIVANLQPIGLYANGSLGGAGELLFSNGTGVYWGPSSGASVNVDAVYSWTNTHTFTIGSVYFNANIVQNTGFSHTISTINSTSNGTLLSNNLITTGNSSVNTQIAPNGLTAGVTVANQLGLYINTNKIIANSTTLFIATTVGINANGTIGTDGQVLKSNGTTAYWGTGTAAGVTQVDTANGIGGGPITTTGSLYAVAGAGVVTNSTGIHVLANNGLRSNSTGVFVLANNGIVSNSTGVFVLANNTNGGLTANATGVFVAANNNFTINSTGLWVNTAGALTLQDLSLNGNLTVSGTLTTIDATNLSVKDNMIILADQLASTTTFLDNVDVGFYEKTGNTTVNFYSGIARIAGNSTNTNPYFKLFSTATVPNNTTIDTGATTGTLQAYLMPWGAGGAFVVNSTAMTLTANSTVALNLTANTLALSTALPATSGGVGHSTFTAGDILYASNTTYLSKLAAGGDGTVLQWSSTTLTWSGLDGGTF